MPPGLPPDRFGLIPFRSPLLRELLLLSFPVGTEMFQFPTFPPPVLCVHTGVTPHNGRRVSPFGHPRINAFSAASRGLSQPDTSFIGSRRQGIHRWLFVAWKNKDARARYAVLKGRGRDDAPAEAGALGALQEDGTENDGTTELESGGRNLRPLESQRTPSSECINWEFSSGMEVISLERR
jgi:hypothetical protein